MKLHFCIFLTLVVGCLSAITTQYKYLQEYGNFTDLDILQCQLRANGNTSCAVRFNTTSTNGVIEEQERCEQLSVDWCHTEVLESGFTYLSKSVVSQTPPFTFYAYSSGPTWELLQQIPIVITKGAKVTVKFTTLIGAGTQIRVHFYTVTSSSTIYETSLNNQAGVKSTVTVEFEDNAIRLNVAGQEYLSGNIGTVTAIRYFEFVFFNNPGDIHLVSYKTAI